MKVYDNQGGRLGNAIFRYLASSLICILYNGERTNSNEDCDQIITDESFIYWFTIILNNQECYPSFDHCYKFNGYFQHDEIYKKYKKELVTWIQTHPNDILKTDGDIPFLNPLIFFQIQSLLKCMTLLFIYVSKILYKIMMLFIHFH